MTEARVIFIPPPGIMERVFEWFAAVFSDAANYESHRRWQKAERQAQHERKTKND